LLSTARNTGSSPPLAENRVPSIAVVTLVPPNSRLAMIPTRLPVVIEASATWRIKPWASASMPVPQRVRTPFSMLKRQAAVGPVALFEASSVSVPPWRFQISNVISMRTLLESGASGFSYR